MTWWHGVNFRLSCLQQIDSETRARTQGPHGEPQPISCTMDSKQADRNINIPTLGVEDEVHEMR